MRGQNLQSHFLTLVTTIFICIFCIFTISSCKKTDKESLERNTPDDVVTTRFLNIPASTNPLVKKVADKIRSQDEASSFLTEFVKKQGFAIWDKSTVKHLAYIPNGQRNNASRTTEGDSINLVIIPLVRANENRVHGALACTIIDDSVTIHLLDGSRYNWYNQHPDSAGNNGEQLSLMLMQLDESVFGHHLFKVRDTTAFGFQRGEKPRYIRLLPSQTNTANHRWVLETLTIFYTTYEDQFEGQVHGCAPGPDCFEYQEVNHSIAFQYYVWVDDDPYPDPDPWYDPNGSGSGGGGGESGGEETPWVPVDDNNYILSDQDQRIFAELGHEDAESDAVWNKDCQGTNRTGNIQWPGTIEHWLIMVDYLSRNTTSEVEYQIPGSSATGSRGYADIANTFSGEIFEIKPDNFDGLKAGLEEVDRYVLKAAQNCPAPSLGFWRKGFAYEERTLISPKTPLKYLKARLSADGVIGYSYVDKPIPQPQPVPIPETIIDKLKRLIEKLRQAGSNFETSIAQFMHENPDLVTYLQTAAFTAAVAIVVGTIVEDILTAGVGITDDWTSFWLAYRIVRFAWKL